MSELISIGKILNFHGIKGEIKAGYTRGRDKILSELREVFIEKSGKQMLLNIETVRFHKQHALIKFKEINSINEAEEIKGSDIKIPKETVNNTLSDEEYLIADLIGMKALNKDDEQIGIVSGFGGAGVSELLEITDGNGKKHLIPFVRELVPIVNTDSGIIVINDIEGLID